MHNTRLYSSIGIFLLCLLFFPQTTNAQSILRGPYLQKVTDNSIVLRWRTDTPTTSKVWFGSDENNLTDMVEDVNSTTEHSIELTGLSPYTQYYYAVGYDNHVLSGEDSDHRFRTFPVEGTVQPIRVWAIGDFGRANIEQQETRDAFLNFTGNRDTDLWLWLGDNAYSDGTDQEFQDKVFHPTNAYGNIMKHMPFQPAPGNHDYNSINSFANPADHEGAYYDIIDVYTNAEAGGVSSNYELYYSFDYGNAHFISINSELQDWIGAIPFSNFNGSEMTDWLEQDLAANDKPWTIVYWHQPPYSKGSHDSDDFWELFMAAMRENIVPILDQYDVDLVLNGHSHVYERSYLIEGHYGTSGSYDPNTMLIDGNSGNDDIGEAYVKYLNGPNKGRGTIYAVVGNTGSNEDNPDMDHPIMHANYGCDTCSGSLVIDIDDMRLDATYINRAGDVLDEFTILKETATSVDETIFTEEVKVYPNPAHEEFTIEYGLSRRAFVQIELYDAGGKLLRMPMRGYEMAGSQKHVIDTHNPHLDAGIYTVRMIVDSQVFSEKLIKIE